MKCENCEYVLSVEEEKYPPVTDVGNLCFACIEKLGKELISKNGDPFGGIDNFNALLDDLITMLIEYQAKHGIEIKVLMALLKAFDTGMGMADASILTTVVKEMEKHGIDTEGGQLYP